MKTTTRLIAIKKLENLPSTEIVSQWGIYKPFKKSTIGYKMVQDVLDSKNGKIIRPCYTSGSGRFTSNQDHTLAVKKILNALSLNYTIQNDAPRGSVTGTFITITTKLR